MNKLSLIKNISNILHVESIKNLSLVKIMNKLSVIKSISNITNVKSINNLPLLKNIIELL